MANVLGSYLANANNYQVSDFEPIKKEQIKVMVDNQNRCSDWSKVYFDRAILDSGAIFESLNSIRNCSFNGNIFLTSFYGNVTSHKGMVVQCGLYDSTFSGRCIIQQNALVTHSYLHNCCIGKEAVVVCCPLVLHSGQSLSYGNIKTISVGNESGGRIVTLSLGSSFQSLVRQAFNAKEPQVVTLTVEDRCDFEDCRVAMVVIGEKAIVFRCNEVIDSIVGDGCSCTSSSLHSSILWFDSSQTSSVVRSVVKGCLLDPGCSATDCNVMDTYLMDQASIGTGARVSNCILGPDASVSRGECSRSILGPSVGFHHSSLLIATIWPLGRGNIAYGAMVGANHTGRLNDQECFPGEGTFFGLGSSVKFPFNSLDSPYSMVAPGTVCLSQRIRFPFSLLSTQDFSINGSSRSMNSLKPGWVLTHNPYFLDRSAAKFRSRGKARHHCTTFSVLRPSIVNLMLDAVRRLQAVSGKDNYDEGDIPGLGKCLMLEKDRLSAIAVYVNYCRRYALQSLLSLEKGEFDATFGAFESQKSHQSPSEVKSSLTLLQLDLDLFAINNDEIKQSEMRGHQRSLLLGLLDSGNTPSLEPLLYELLDLETQHANAVLACRKKDERGASIIEDYKDVHIKAEEDPVVIAAFENLTFIKRRVETLLTCDP